jgi:hypothetical protein
VVIDLIVLSVTLLMVGFVAVWWLCPRSRPWFEAPKYRILTWERSYPRVVRPEAAELGEPSSVSYRVMNTEAGPSPGT